MGNIAGEGARLPGNRERKRDSMLLMGTIRAAGDYARATQSIRVRNLSSTGMMAVTDIPYEEGSSVEVEIRGIGLVSGEIVWIKGNRLGITFSEPVDPMLARRKVEPQDDDHLRKLVELGRVRRPGLRID